MHREEPRQNFKPQHSDFSEKTGMWDRNIDHLELMNLKGYVLLREAAQAIVMTSGEKGNLLKSSARFSG